MNRVRSGATQVSNLGESAENLEPRTNAADVRRMLAIVRKLRVQLAVQFRGIEFHVILPYAVRVENHPSTLDRPTFPVVVRARVVFRNARVRSGLCERPGHVV